MRELINIIDTLTESWSPRFDSVKVYRSPKSISLYHSSNDKPRISTKSNRLIPRSLSATSRSPDYLWGSKAYKFIIPAGTIIGELPNIFSILPDGAMESPINIGIILRKWAADNGIQILKIRRVGGVGTEWAILDPRLIKNSTEI
jgi:hypothetical protein